MHTNKIPYVARKYMERYPEKFIKDTPAWMEDDGYEDEYGEWSLWMALAPGYCVDGEQGFHIIHESNRHELPAKFQGISKCECERCVSGERDE